jgi:hypothetical protein
LVDFAADGLGASHEVTAVHDMWDGLSLDGGWRVSAFSRYGMQQFGAQAE